MVSRSSFSRARVGVGADAAVGHGERAVGEGHDLVGACPARGQLADPAVAGLRVPQAQAALAGLMGVLGGDEHPALLGEGAVALQVPARVSGASASASASSHRAPRESATVREARSERRAGGPERLGEAALPARPGGRGGGEIAGYGADQRAGAVAFLKGHLGQQSLERQQPAGGDGGLGLELGGLVRGQERAQGAARGVALVGPEGHGEGAAVLLQRAHPQVRYTHPGVEGVVAGGPHGLGLAVLPRGGVERGGRLGEGGHAGQGVRVHRLLHPGEQGRRQGEGRAAGGTRGGLGHHGVSVREGGGLG